MIEETISDSQLKLALLVDDDPVAMKLEKFYLEKHGFIVTISPNGTDVTSFYNVKFDLIILDISLPDIDGISVAKLINVKSSFNKNTPVIFITSHSYEDIPNNSFDKQIFIKKPLNGITFDLKLKELNTLK